MSVKLKQQISILSSTYFEETIKHRHQIHRFPELSFQEYVTADYVEKTLLVIGFTAVTRLAKTGVIALLHDKNTVGKTIGLRADLDALPIQETNDIAYKSSINGLLTFIVWKLFIVRFTAGKRRKAEAPNKPKTGRMLDNPLPATIIVETSTQSPTIVRTSNPNFGNACATANL